MKVMCQDWVSQRWVVNNTHHQHLWSQCLKFWPHTRIFVLVLLLNTHFPLIQWPSSSWNLRSFHKILFHFPSPFLLGQDKSIFKKTKVKHCSPFLWSDSVKSHVVPSFFPFLKFNSSYTIWCFPMYFFAYALVKSGSILFNHHCAAWISHVFALPFQNFWKVSTFHKGLCQIVGVVWKLDAAGTPKCHYWS